MKKDDLKEYHIMAEELERFRSSFEMLLEHSRERDIKVDQMVARVDEMYKVFNNGTFLVTVIKWGFGLVLALGGGYLMFKHIANGLAQASVKTFDGLANASTKTVDGLANV